MSTFAARTLKNDMLAVDISLFDYCWDPDPMEVTEERRFDIGIRELVIDALNEQFKNTSVMITLKVDEDGYYDGCDTALMSTTIIDDEDTQRIYGLPLPWTTRARKVSFTRDKPLVRQFVPPNKYAYHKVVETQEGIAKIHKTVIMEKTPNSLVRTERRTVAKRTRIPIQKRENIYPR